jgi:hypothetical protein
MNVEQLPPNKPNFLLILTLFGVTIIVIFVLAWFFLRGDANHLGLRHHPRHPTSQLVLPHTSATHA